MKNRIFATIIAALSLLAISCGDISTERETSVEKAYLSISMGDVNARTIFPETIDVSDTSLSFVLTGKKSGSASIQKTWATYTAMTGDTSILLETGAWAFTLTVSKNTSEILKSTVSAEITAGQNTLSFTTWEKDETATGSVSVTLTFPTGKKVSTVKAGLFELDGTETANFAPESLTISDTTDENGTAQKTVTYAKNGVPAGYHRIRFLLYTEDNTLVARDSDIILVSKNLTSSDKRTLTAFNTAYEINYLYPENMQPQTEISNPVCFTENEAVTLPAQNMGAYKAYFSPEFHRMSDYSDEKITGWGTKEVTDDQTLYVKWVTTASYVEGAISIASANDYPVYMTGAITSDTLATIKNTSKNVYTANETTISLDLDDTTGLTEIAEKEFYECTWLKGIVIPKSVTTLGKTAFAECTNLASVTLHCNADIPDGDNWERIFYNCKLLTDVTIGDGITKIGDYAFYECNGLKSITIPDNIISIGENAFAYTGLTSIEIPSSITSISGSTFSYCQQLNSVTIPDSVTSIGRAAFYDCRNLTSITIPDTITSIEECVFSDCQKLPSLIIPSTVTSIGDGAFFRCKSLTSITIPDKVTFIGEGAFEECSGLTNIEIPSGVTSINPRTFHDCIKLMSITIPDSVTSIGMNAFGGCTNLTSITIPNTVTSINIYAFSTCRSLTSITIPNSVTSIAGFAFYNCTGLTSITIPNGVKSIDEAAFRECKSLTLITIPNTVTSVGQETFAGCTSLKSITIPNSIESISAAMFYNCTSLTSITIPDSVTSIESNAFGYCEALPSIFIPSSVTSLGFKIFENCTSLTSITFNKTTGWFSTSDKTLWQNKSGGDKIEDISAIAISDFVNENSAYYNKYLYRIEE